MREPFSAFRSLYFYCSWFKEIVGQEKEGYSGASVMSIWWKRKKFSSPGRVQPILW